MRLHSPGFPDSWLFSLFDKCTACARWLTHWSTKCLCVGEPCPGWEVVGVRESRVCAGQGETPAQEDPKVHWCGGIRSGEFSHGLRPDYNKPSWVGTSFLRYQRGTGTLLRQPAYRVCLRKNTEAQWPSLWTLLGSPSQPWFFKFKGNNFRMIRTGKQHLTYHQQDYKWMPFWKAAWQCASGPWIMHALCPGNSTSRNLSWGNYEKRAQMFTHKKAHFRHYL